MPAKKLFQIMSKEAYERANAWYASRHPGVPAYAAVPVDTIYTNTSHRNYLSIWIERFIVRFINDVKPEWQAVKVDNRGKAQVSRYTGGKMHGKVATVTYVKNQNQVIGEPDIRVLRPGMMPLYFEVKIKADRLSQAQSDFIRAGFGEVYVIKTLDEFFNIWDKINTTDK